MAFNNLEKSFQPKIVQYVVVHFLKANKQFTPQFLAAIQQLHREGDQLRDSLLRELPPPIPRYNRIECKKGCAHCCGLTVKATLPELFIIFETLLKQYRESELIELMNRLQERVRLKQEQGNRTDRLKINCTFLENDICTIYETRPLSCRAWNSTSVRHCIAFNTDPEVEIPLSDRHYLPYHLISKGISNALSALGISSPIEELNEGLLALLQGEFGKTGR